MSSFSSKIHQNAFGDQRCWKSQRNLTALPRTSLMYEASWIKSGGNWKEKYNGK